MKVGELLGRGALEEREQPTPYFCLPKCYIGLEYEWENVQRLSKASPSSLPLCIPKMLEYYSTHVDHSLRGNAMEFTFKGPYSGTKLLNAIEAMDEASRSLGFTSSYRTSLHVHLDTNSLNFPYDIVKLATLYAISEPFIYKFIARSREGCNYCVPWYINSQHYEQFAQIIFLEGVSKDELRSHLHNAKAYKYAGLNFFSLSDFGTLEFRHAPVDMQMAKIIVWINMIMRMKKFTLEQRITPEGIVDFACKAGPERFIREVFADEHYNLLKLNRTIEDDFQIGLKTAYHLVAITQKE